MPVPISEGYVRSSWQAFVRALRSVLIGLPEHRHEDQFLQIREAALKLAERPEVADEIERAYWAAQPMPNVPPAGPPNVPPANVAAAHAAAVDLVVMELDALPMAVAVYEAETKNGTAKLGAASRLREAAKTLLGSVGDVFKLTDMGKAVISTLKEGFELIEGK